MRKASRACAVAHFLFLVASTSSPALADPPATTNESQALDLFEKGSEAYRKGNFAEAVNLLQKAYALKREPVLLYNLGRAYEGLGDLKRAAQAYADYLASDPNAPDRGALEQRIATLKRQAKERDELEQRAREESKDGRGPSVWPWFVTGIGVSGVVTGIVFGRIAASRHDKAVAEPTYVRAEDLQQNAETFATVANVLLVAGAVVAIGGIVWGVLDLSSGGRRASAPGRAELTF
jgi:tetratricopeptide (TPR) repeat protein